MGKLGSLCQRGSGSSLICDPQQVKNNPHTGAVEEPFGEVRRFAVAKGHRTAKYTGPSYAVLGYCLDRCTLFRQRDIDGSSGKRSAPVSNYAQPLRPYRLSHPSCFPHLYLLL
ncbi:hypothetical protein ES703_85912 [subsurface metagenome]